MAAHGWLAMVRTICTYRCIFPYIHIHTHVYVCTPVSVRTRIFMCACIYTALHTQSHSPRTHPFYSYSSSLRPIPMLCYLTYPSLSYIPQHLILLYPILYYLFCFCPILRNHRLTFITFHFPSHPIIVSSYLIFLLITSSSHLIFLLILISSLFLFL